MDEFLQPVAVINLPPGQIRLCSMEMSFTVTEELAPGPFTSAPSTSISGHWTHG